MRISDWSSDVCSSDLVIGKRAAHLDQRLDPFGFDRLNAQRHLAVIEQQPGTRLERLKQLAVRQADAALVTRDFAAVEAEDIAARQLGQAFPESDDTDLGAFPTRKYCPWPAEFP